MGMGMRMVWYGYGYAHGMGMGMHMVWVWVCTWYGYGYAHGMGMGMRMVWVWVCAWYGYGYAHGMVWVWVCAWYGYVTLSGEAFSLWPWGYFTRHHIWACSVVGKHCKVWCTVNQSIHLTCSVLFWECVYLSIPSTSFQEEMFCVISDRTLHAYMWLMFLPIEFCGIVVDPQYMTISYSCYCSCMSVTVAPVCLFCAPRSVRCHHGEYTKCKEAFWENWQIELTFGNSMHVCCTSACTHGHHHMPLHAHMVIITCHMYSVHTWVKWCACMLYALVHTVTCASRDARCMVQRGLAI